MARLDAEQRLAAELAREEARIAALEEANALVLRGDWTRRDPDITVFLTQQGVAGVPLYLWYAPGSAQPERLPQVLTPRSVIDRALTNPGRPVARRGGSSR